MRYICEGKCIELDRDNTPHCIEYINSELEWMDLLNKDCPLGNTAKWVRKELAERPVCYTSNDASYPLCKGNDKAIHDCKHCCLYEDMFEQPYGDKVNKVWKKN